MDIECNVNRSFGVVTFFRALRQYRRMANLSRRRLLHATGAAGALGLLAGTPAQALDRALRETVKRTASTAGTTLEAAATPTGTGFRRLAAGPGFPLVVRPDLASPQSGRDDRRTVHRAGVRFRPLHR